MQRKPLTCVDCPHGKPYMRDRKQLTCIDCIQPELNTIKRNRKFLTCEDCLHADFKMFDGHVDWLFCRIKKREVNPNAFRNWKDEFECSDIREIHTVDNVELKELRKKEI